MRVSDDREIKKVPQIRELLGSRQLDQTWA